MTGHHAFIDGSKRKPYRCGVCGRDITDPYHQPRLFSGMVFEIREEAIEAFTEPEPEKPKAQLDLFQF